MNASSGTPGAGGERQHAHPHRWNQLWVALPAVAAAFAYAWFAWWMPISLDSGVFLYTARGVLEHRPPYLASWDDKGPLLYLLDAAGLWLGGGSPRGAYLLEGAALAGSLWVCARLWAGAVGSRVSVLLGMMFLVSYLGWCDFGLRSESWLVPFQLLAYTVVACRTREHGAGGYRGDFAVAALVGAATAIALLTRPNDAAGLVILALSRLWPGAGPRRDAALGLATGAGLIAVPVLAYVVLSGALRAFIDQYFLFSFYYATGASIADRVKGARYLLSDFGQAPLWATLLVIAGMRLGKDSPLGATVKLFSIIALADVMSQMLSGRGYMQYWLVYLPALTVLTVALGAELDVRSRLKGPALPLVAWLLVVMAAGGAVKAANTLLTARATGFHNSAAAHARVAAYLSTHTSQNDRVLALGYDISMLAATARHSPTTLAYVIPLLVPHARPRSAMRRRYIDELVHASPRLIVDDWPSTEACGARNPIPAWENEAGLEGLCRWILRHYVPATEIGGYRVWAWAAVPNQQAAKQPEGASGTSR